MLPQPLCDKCDSNQIRLQRLNRPICPTAPTVVMGRKPNVTPTCTHKDVFKQVAGLTFKGFHGDKYEIILLPSNRCLSPYLRNQLWVSGFQHDNKWFSHFLWYKMLPDMPFKTHTAFHFPTRTSKLGPDRVYVSYKTLSTWHTCAWLCYAETLSTSCFHMN